MPLQNSWLVLTILCATFATTASAATRPHYGGTLRVLLQSAPETLDFPANPTPIAYWDAARTLSLIGDLHGLAKRSLRTHLPLHPPPRS